MRNDERPTEWVLYECIRGSRWSTAHEWVRDPNRGTCNFSGCDKKLHEYRAIRTTQDRDEASGWFRRTFADAEADTRRRENLSKPTRDYPGAEQMMAYQRLK